MAQRPPQYVIRLLSSKTSTTLRSLKTLASTIGAAGSICNSDSELIASVESSRSEGILLTDGSISLSQRSQDLVAKHMIVDLSQSVHTEANGKLPALDYSCADGDPCSSPWMQSALLALLQRRGKRDLRSFIRWGSASHEWQRSSPTTLGQATQAFALGLHLPEPAASPLVVAANTFNLGLAPMKLQPANVTLVADGLNAAIIMRFLGRGLPGDRFTDFARELHSRKIGPILAMIDKGDVREIGIFTPIAERGNAVPNIMLVINQTASEDSVALPTDHAKVG